MLRIRSMATSKIKSTYDERSNSQDPERRMKEPSWSMNWERRKTKRSRNTAHCTTPWSRNTAQCRTPSQTETPPSTEDYLVRTGAKIRGIQRDKPTTTPQREMTYRQPAHDQISAHTFSREEKNCYCQVSLLWMLAVQMFRDMTKKVNNCSV